jgi:hypothetical protein
MVGVELYFADVIEPEVDESGNKKKPNDKLQIQLLFYASGIKKGSDKIIPLSEMKNMHGSLEDGILAKFKVEEDIFQKLMQLGLEEGTLSDWDVIPQAWSMPGKFKEGKQEPGKTGTWYQPAALIKLNGKEINYQILKSQAIKKPRQNAFERFRKSSNTHSAWGNELGNLEHQINAELEGATP